MFTERIAALATKQGTIVTKETRRAAFGSCQQTIDDYIDFLDRWARWLTREMERAVRIRTTDGIEEPTWAALREISRW